MLALLHLRALTIAKSRRYRRAAVCCALLIGLVAPSLAIDSPAELAIRYTRQIDRRLELPPSEQRVYAEALDNALRSKGILPLASQLFVLVDRSQHVQAVMVFWRGASGESIFIGASPASTGRPSGFEHFETPLGVFEHSIANPDFRAEGTQNELGICGYGIRGMRVFDFGWIPA